VVSRALNARAGKSDTNQEKAIYSMASATLLCHKIGQVLNVLSFFQDALPVV